MANAVQKIDNGNAAKVLAKESFDSQLKSGNEQNNDATAKETKPDGARTM